MHVMESNFAVVFW